MFELDNRQIATLIWFAAIVIALAAIPKMRKAAGPAFLAFLKTLTTWKILVPFAVYFLYAGVIVLLAQRFGLWHKPLLVDTVIIVFFVGIPMFMNANKIRNGEQLFKNTLRDTLGISALIVFYIGLEPFALPAELILQPIIAFLAICSTVAKHKPEFKLAKCFFDGLLVITGVWFIIRTTSVIVSTWTSKQAYQSLQELLLSIVLPLLLLPLIYLFAIIMVYEMLLRSLPHFNEQRRLPRGVYAALFIGLNVRLGLLNNFIGMWRQKIANMTNFREAMSLLGAFKKAMRLQNKELKNYHKRLRKMSGVHGVDENGLQRDRREFRESKSELTSLLYMQMGQFRNRFKHYNPDFPFEAVQSKLPKNNSGVSMKFRKDKLAWYAWRRMPNGYYFGVGGSPHVDDVWLYDGNEPPQSYPSPHVKGWVNSAVKPKSPEWNYNDEPPTMLSNDLAL